MIRLLQLLVAIAKISIGPRKTLGTRLCRELKTLNGLWVKLGQMASTRYDLLPYDICEALQPLQANIEGTSGAYATDYVERELGKDVFKSFNDKPVAAATIAQVHKAYLKNGTPVAVKILHSGIRQKYAQDIKLLGRLSWIVDKFRPQLMFSDMVSELVHTSKEDLDLRYEAHHQHLMRKILKKHHLHVPIVYKEYCTQNIMVSQWIEGTLLTDLLEKPAELASLGFTGKKLSRRLLSSLQRQVFEHKRFHNDMHPGNIIITPDKAWVIDFGSTAMVEAGFLDVFMSFNTALGTRHFARAADLYCSMSAWPQGVNTGGYAVLRRELIRIMENWYTQTQIKALPFNQKSIHCLAMQMMTAIMLAGGAMQWGWLRLSRAFFTLEGLLGSFYPELNQIKELNNYLAGAAERQKPIPINPVEMSNIMSRALARFDEYGRLKLSAMRFEGIEKEL